MKLYLSGPISGHDLKERFEAFKKVEEKVKALGHEAVNPMVISPPELDYKDCMREDLKALLDCDGIVLMDGWQNSKGCIVEFYVASVCGIQVFKDTINS